MMDDRKLTKAEEKRTKIFLEISNSLKNDGYNETNLTKDALSANLVGSLYGFIVAIPFLILFFIVKRNIGFNVDESFFRNYIIFFVALIVSIVIHELIHGFTWSRFTQNKFKDIEFGIIWKSLNPYCTCKVPLNRKAYIMGLIMPCLVLGVIPCIIAIINGNGWLLTYGIFMIVSAGGDLLIGKMILDTKTKENALFIDHPTTIGLVVFEK